MFKRFINKDDGLLKAGGIFLIGSMLGSAFNYLYHLFMGRMLGPAEYGVLGSLFAIIYLVGFSSQTFNKVISKYCAEFEGTGKKMYLKRLVERSLIKILIFGIILLILFTLCIPFIAKFMKIDDYFGIFLVGVIAFISMVSAILTGALNGLQKFIWQNSVGTLNTFLKFSLAVLLVFFGFGVRGALIAIIIATSIGIFLGLYPLIKDLQKVKAEKFKSKKIYIYAIPVFLASLIPMMLITFDQILVKHFFTSQDAGFYAAAGMIAKIIWFGSGIFAMALFPKISNLISKGKDVSGLLIKSVIYTSFLVLIGCSAYFVFPTFIVGILYGSSYVSIVPYIGIFGLAMGFFSISQILVTFNLAMERYSFIWIFFIGFIIELIAIILYHYNVYNIIQISFGVNLFILISLLFYNRNDLGVNYV